MKIKFVGFLIFLLALMLIPSASPVQALPEQPEMIVVFQEGDPPEESIPIDPETLAALIDYIADLETQLSGTTYFDSGITWAIVSLITLVGSAGVVKTTTGIIKTRIEAIGLIDHDAKGFMRDLFIWTIAIGSGIGGAWFFNEANVFVNAPYVFLNSLSNSQQVTLTGLLAGLLSIPTHEVLSTFGAWLSSVKANRKRQLASLRN